MTEREQAIETLKKARDLLADKITETVNADPDFAEALADEWSDAAEKVLELGERMRRLVQVIDYLPLPRPQPDFVQSDTLSCFAVGSAPTWEDFLEEVELRNLPTAASLLASLTELDLQIARRATDVFVAQVNLDPTYMDKARSLRAQLACNTTGSLNLIRELFGIGGDVAVRAYNSLKVTM